ncbi:flagellar biosynthetic protein FliR [Deltaproteobacteria bacterium Smac51]|nr:flagellar biosynthetic protein FliR [Deltaproteobacteria bacterium Smac51]
MGAPIINAAEFTAYVLVLLRVSTVIVFAPIFSGNTVLTQVKVLLCLMMTFAVAPQVEYNASMLPMTWYGYVPLMLGEFIIGFTLSFMVKVILEAVKMAGEYMSFQMSLSMLNSMDPTSGGQTPQLALLLHMFMSLIFLYANGHMLLIKAMVESFTIAPPGLLNIWRPEIFTEVIRAMLGMNILALQIAGPVIGVLFCVKAAFGIVAKAVPQMNILFVGIPVYIIVGFSVLGFSMPWWPQILGQLLVGVDGTLDRLLHYFAPVQ